MRRFSCKLLLFGAATALLALSLTGCGDTTAAPAPREDKWGTIKGQAVWGEKDLPKVVKENVNRDVEACLRNGPIHSQIYIVDPKTKGVKNVFVWLVDANDPQAHLPIHPDLKEISDKAVTIDLPCCYFEPHAAILRQGQTLLGKNSDIVAHSFHLSAGPVDKNWIMEPNAPLRAITDLPALSRPGMVQCSIHPWMRAWVMVCDSPYYALTAGDGTFEIKNAPAGEWRMITWHEGMGWVAFDNPDKRKDGKLIKIKGGETLDLGDLKIVRED